MNQNPYLQGQADQISSNMTRNFNTQVMPQINSGAMAAGGFGSSRQAIAQSLGMRGLNDSIGQAQTNLYSNAYSTDQANQLQRDLSANQLATQSSIAGMQNQTTRDLGFGNLDLGKTQAQNQYNLGLGGLGANMYQADQNFYTNQRGQDLSQYSLGLQATQAGNNGLAGQGQQLWNLGLGEQNAGWTPLQNYGQGLSQFSGLNQSSNQTTPGASGLQNAIAGGLTAAQLWQLLSGGK